MKGKKSSKGPIIAVIVIVVLIVLGVAGYFIWQSLNTLLFSLTSSIPPESSARSSEEPQTTAEVQTPSSEAQSRMSPESLMAQASALYDFAKEDLEIKEDVSRDYTNTYGGEFGEFKSTTGKSGLAGGDYVDLDNDGQDELIFVIWKYNTATGNGYNQVYVYDMIDGKPKRINCGRSAEYGNTDHVSQVAYHDKDDGGYIYLTTAFSATTHEGGYCNPSIAVYRYTNGKAEQLCDTSAGLTAEASIEDRLDSLAGARDYLPEVVDGWYAAINKDNYHEVCGWSVSKKDSVPLFGALDKFDSDITVMCINYLMRSRQDPDKAGTGTTYNGYWEIFSEE